MKSWIHLVYLADEFIVTYFCPPVTFHNARAKYFTLGHALELYLKAFYFKNTDNWDQTVKFGHGIWRLLEECKKIDPTLLSKYNFNKKSYEIISTNGVWDGLNAEETTHLMENNEFYQICKYKGDLKYLGLPRKGFDRPDAVGINVPNKYWAHILGEIRGKLNFPPENCDDSLKTIFDDPYAPLILKEWIKVMTTGTGGDGLPFISCVTMF